MKHSFAIFSIVAVSVCSCTVTGTLGKWILGNQSASYFPLEKGNYWRYAIFEIDSVGRKTERKDLPEYDSVQNVEDKWNRRIACIRRGNPTGYAAFQYSYSEQGNLQILADTGQYDIGDSFDKKYDEEQRKKMPQFAYWDDLERFGDSTTSQVFIKKENVNLPIYKHNTQVGFLVRGRTHFRALSGDSVMVEVPAGRFITQVRVDSTVDSLIRKMQYGSGKVESVVPVVPPLVLTTITKRYYAKNIGLVLEQASVSIPVGLSKYLHDEETLDLGFGTHTMELVRFRAGSRRFPD